MKKALIIFCTVWSASVSGQSISPEVIASAGEHFSNGTSQLSFTIGETVIDTYTAGGNILTQGFHQTQLTITAVRESVMQDMEVNVYPNPSSGELNISFTNNDQQFELMVYDMNGKVVMTRTMAEGQTAEQLQLGPLANAYYLLQLNAVSGSYSSTYRIQKTGH